jgi:predicted metal-dependent phosphoesterase TrpH
MKIDLHVHTYPRSACSDIRPQDLIARAKAIGLDGLCLTEHQVLWSPEEVRELAADSGITIFRGCEVTTAQGDVLVFGLKTEIQRIVTIQALRQIVDEAGAYCILAHPFRGFKTFGMTDLQTNIAQAALRKAFRFVHAVEIRNGKVSDSDNTLAEKVAETLNLPGTGGSDAHHIDNLGDFVTVFDHSIRTDNELIAALQAGVFKVSRGH